MRPEAGIGETGEEAMYKRQVRLQRIFCLLALIASALVFVYSLGLVTDLYDSLYTTIPNANNLDKTYVEGSRIFYDIQPFNKHLMPVGLGLILISLGLYITQTHARRRYYIGNYVATGVWVAAAVAVSFWMHKWVTFYKVQFQTQLNFEELAAYAEKFNTMPLTRNDTFWFDIHYLVMAVLLVMAAVMVVNVIWKINLMKQEAALLAGAPAKEQGSAPAKIQ